MYKEIILSKYLQDDYSDIAEGLELNYHNKTVYVNRNNNGFYFNLDKENSKLNINIKINNEIKLINSVSLTDGLKLYCYINNNNCIFSIYNNKNCPFIYGYAEAKGIHSQISFITYFYIIEDTIYFIHNETGKILYSQKLPNRSKTNTSGECKLIPFIISEYDLYFDELFIADIFKETNVSGVNPRFTTNRGEYVYSLVKSNNIASLIFRRKRS